MATYGKGTGLLEYNVQTAVDKPLVCFGNPGQGVDLGKVDLSSPAASTAA